MNQQEMETARQTVKRKTKIRILESSDSSTFGDIEERKTKIRIFESSDSSKLQRKINCDIEDCQKMGYFVDDIKYSSFRKLYQVIYSAMIIYKLNLSTGYYG